MLSTKLLKTSGIIKSMKALKLPESHISAIRKNLEYGGEVQIGGGGPCVARSFSAPESVAVGFESVGTGFANEKQGRNRSR
jgi:hypothetical protein